MAQLLISIIFFSRVFLMDFDEMAKEKKEMARIIYFSQRLMRVY